MICQKCYVSGIVQGVFFRDTVQKQAKSLSINGHVCNMPNGTVEVFMCGSKQQLKTMEDWLWEGSSHSDVTGVKCHSINAAIPQQFVIK